MPHARAPSRYFLINGVVSFFTPDCTAPGTSLGSIAAQMAAISEAMAYEPNVVSPDVYSRSSCPQSGVRQPAIRVNTLAKPSPSERTSVG